jgi:hypothetical protein
MHWFHPKTEFSGWKLWFFLKVQWIPSKTKLFSTKLIDWFLRYDFLEKNKIFLTEPVRLSLQWGSYGATLTPKFWVFEQKLMGLVAWARFFWITEYLITWFLITHFFKIIKIFHNFYIFQNYQFFPNYWISLILSFIFENEIFLQF